MPGIRGTQEEPQIWLAVLTSTPTDFHVSAELDAYEGDQRVLSKNWSSTIPRDFI